MVCSMLCTYAIAVQLHLHSLMFIQSACRCFYFSFPLENRHMMPCTLPVLCFFSLSVYFCCCWLSWLFLFFYSISFCVKMLMEKRQRESHIHTQYNNKRKQKHLRYITLFVCLIRAGTKCGRKNRNHPHTQRTGRNLHKSESQTISK